MLDTMSVRDITIDGIKPAVDVSEMEHDGCRELCKQALLLIQSLSKPIVDKKRCIPVVSLFQEGLNLVRGLQICNFLNNGLTQD